MKQPYLGLAAATVLLAVLIKLAQLPTVGGEGRIVADAGALRYKHLVLGMIAIFAYIGSEVTVGSNFISFLKLPQLGGFSQTEAKDYLTFFWAGAMVGRFFGAVTLAQFRRQVYKYGILVLIIFIAFVVIYGLYGPESGIRMLGLILLNVVVLMLGRFVPQRTLTFFAGSVVVLLGVVATQSGSVALWAIVGIGLFNSIMFPSIFALAIKGLGVYTRQGSSLLVMACVGGAIVPPLQGLLADLTGNLQLSFLLPVGCYLFLIYYGIWGYSSDGHEAQPGTLGVVQNGDVITLDVPARMLHINLTEEELRQRKTLWQDSQRLVGRGYIHLFQQHVQQSHLGADFDFLRGCSGSEVVRDSH